MAEERSPVAGCLQARQSTATTLRFEQPFLWRPASLTVAAYEPDGDTLAASLTPTLGVTRALDNSTFGVGQSDATLLTLADGSQAETDFRRLDRCVVGRNAAAMERDYHEDFRVAQYDYAAGSTQGLYAMRGLRHEYTNSGGSPYSVWSKHHTVSLTATHTATLGRNYRLELTWTDAAGNTYESHQMFDVVADPLENPFSVDRLREREPSLLEALEETTSARGGTADERLEQAFEDVIDVVKTVWSPDLLRDRHLLFKPVVWALRCVYAKSAGQAPPGWDVGADEYAQFAEEQMGLAIDKLANNTALWVDENEDLAATDEEIDKPNMEAAWLSW